MNALERTDDPGAARSLQRYVWVVRVSLGIALLSAIAFLFVVRASVFTPDTTNWPLIACVVLWVVGMAVALWARSRIRSMSRVLRASAAGNGSVTGERIS
jgi:FtsH-binding integral membrane protein